MRAAWRQLLACAALPIAALADASGDWLVTRPTATSAVTETPDGGLVISNGLVARRFVLTPAFGTIDVTLNATTARGGVQSLFRAVKAEGMIKLDGTTYDIGGLRQARTFLAYCNRSDFALAAGAGAFSYAGHSVSEPAAPFPWTPGARHSPSGAAWPPRGKHLAVRFAPPAGVPPAVRLTVHYEVYDGVPVLAKWVTVAMGDEPAAPAPAAPRRTHGSPPRDYEGWSVAGGAMQDTAASGLCLTQKGATEAAPAAAVFATRADNVGCTLGAHGSSGERQTNIGLSTSSAATARDKWDFLLAVDSGGCYSAVAGQQPLRIAACAEGDAVSLSYDRDARRATVFHNGEAAGWLDAAFQGSPALYPQVRVNYPGGMDACRLAPKCANCTAPPTPAPPPTPPPPPPGSDVVVEAVTVELLGVMPRWGNYPGHGSHAPGSDWGGASSGVAPLPLLHAKTDQAHGAQCSWHDDWPNSKDSIPSCSTCKDEGAVEPFLSCSYTSGPGAHVTAGGESFESFRVIALVADSAEVERHALSRHRVTQLLAPHTQENPVFFHATKVSDPEFRAVIDQMAETGFEMLIYSFGSGFKLESSDASYLAKIKGQVDYAKSKGIEVGGYDLICLDRGNSIPAEWRAGGDEGNACFASGWADKLRGLVLNFINATGLSMLETDGPYGGGSCSSTSHAHHHGLEDSVYRQTQMQNNFFRDMRELGVYVNQPDNYFFQGGSRTGMGYDEQQYSLPRWRDLSISRMGMYDDMYSLLPTQGWMQVPIDQYHAGGGAATFKGHYAEYEWALAQYLGAGTAACYRGSRVYSSDAIRGMVTKWVSWYKAHRQALVQPVVHIRRADMQGWDGWLHVHPFAAAGGGAAAEVGVAMLFNPTDASIPAVVPLPLYYCGLDDAALLSVNGAAAQRVALNRDYSAHLRVDMPPRSVHTVVVSRPT